MENKNTTQQIFKRMKKDPFYVVSLLTIIKTW